ncbi:Cyclochlorotine biosynthesis protein O [Colletotrichum fructicola]|uniref:Cyclochlorotine biosynthesis protein O n=2 Tax=Colletotrichum fructicola (strain Nara gc5) TaxID=1213859 RepID=L2FEK1_COLFN|nr:Cyclochlorotine biosynthesis protein O [Colletotrichum fructicola]KAF4897607.1 Cyclochlorotine biosynthesis protein O [Colletotrichum fructicola]KAF4930878.1 Cyclochlorotine biosynthesis protein O [Colletotrichum fructicola]
MAGRYFPLTEAKDAAEPELEGFLSDSDKPKMYPRGGSSRMTLRDKFASSLFVASCVLLGLSVWIHLHPKPPTDRQCVRQLNVPSPVHDVLEYEEVQFDNAFWKPSPYKGKPTPELEAKWKELWYYGSFDLPDSYLPSMNKSSGGIGGDPWARTESGNLLAGLEVFHNLHCLNLVRQYAHKDEYDYSNDPAFHGSPELVLAHVDHCIEALRIRLQCAADVTPFLHTKGGKGTQPDFNSQHRCPKYDRIVGWAKERQIMVEKSDSKEGHGHHG